MVARYVRGPSLKFSKLIGDIFFYATTLTHGHGHGQGQANAAHAHPTYTTGTEEVIWPF